MNPQPSTAGIVYSPGQIGWAAFLGTPVAASWFMARNYRELGKPATARTSLIWGITGTVVLGIACRFLPDWIPDAAIPIGYSMGLLNMAKQLFGPFLTLEERIRTGRRFAPWWKVSGISVLFGLLIALPFVAAMFWFK